jgi:hypothetical protein
MWRQTLLDVHQKGLIGGQAIANKKSNGKAVPTESGEPPLPGD